MSAYYGASNGHYKTGLTALSAPLTMSAWLKLDALSAASAIAFQLSGGTWVTYWFVWDTSIDKWYFGGRNGGTDFRAQQTSTAGTDWMHMVGVAASSTSRKLFINGVEEAENTSSVPISCTVLSVGFRTDGAVPSSGGAYFAGQVADAAVWTSALTAAQVASLAAGASPLVVAPADLRLYAPLRNGSGVDLKAATALSSYGTPTAGVSHPRLYPA